MCPEWPPRNTRYIQLKRPLRPLPESSSTRCHYTLQTPTQCSSEPCCSCTNTLLVTYASPLAHTTHLFRCLKRLPPTWKLSFTFLALHAIEKPPQELQAKTEETNDVRLGNCASPKPFSHTCEWNRRMRFLPRMKG